MQVTVWPRGKRRTVYSGPLGIDWGAFTRVVGSPVHCTQYGKLEELSFTTRYEDGFGGHDQATWTFKPHGNFVGGLFRPGDHVRIRKGGGTCFEGEFSEAIPGEDGRVTMKAKGYAYNLISDYDSTYWKQRAGDVDIYYPTNRLTGGNLSTTWYGWDYATDVMGMPISMVSGTIPAGAYGSAESTMLNEPTYLGPVLTARLRESGARWAVWGRSLVIGADNTTPLWRYNAPESVVGIADTDYATHVRVWYVAKGAALWLTGTSYALNAVVEYEGEWWISLQAANAGHVPNADASTWWARTPTLRKPSDYSYEEAIDSLGLQRFDVRAVTVDMRGLGLMDSVRADTLANNLLAQVKGRFTLSGSFEVTPESGFTSINGGPADLAFVRAGRIVTLNNLRTSQANLMPDGGDVMIGRTDYSWIAPRTPREKASESLTITPMGATQRNVADILRGVPGEAADTLAASAA